MILQIETEAGTPSRRGDRGHAGRRRACGSAQFDLSIAMGIPGAFDRRAHDRQRRTGCSRRCADAGIAAGVLVGSRGRRPLDARARVPHGRARHPTSTCTGARSAPGSRRSNRSERSDVGVAEDATHSLSPQHLTSTIEVQTSRLIRRKGNGMRDRAQTVIVGAGIVGASAAYHLAELGVDRRPGDRPGAAVRDRRVHLARARPGLPDERLAHDVPARAGHGRAVRLARARRRAVLVRRRRARGRDHARSAWRS